MHKLTIDLQTFFSYSTAPTPVKLLLYDHTTTTTKLYDHEVMNLSPSNNLLQTLHASKTAHYIFIL
jgi:hypothetical protein